MMALFNSKDGVGTILLIFRIYLEYEGIEVTILKSEINCPVRREYVPLSFRIP